MQVTMLHVGDAVQNRQIAEQAAQVLRAGGLVVFPTETVYGIAASVASDKGWQALNAFKQRPVDQPFTIHLSDPSEAGRYIDDSSPTVQRLVRKVLPGPVTLVVDVPDRVIEQKAQALRLGAEGKGRLYFRNTVGLRCPDLDIARQLLRLAGKPVVASSANRRGQSPPIDAEEAAQAVGDAADLLIDGGRCRYAKPSTVVRVRHSSGLYKWTIERAGVYDERFIRKLMQWTMLIVCTGNTCRSPIAEALAKQMIASQRGVTPADLEASGVHIISAGTHAYPGMPASPEAVTAMSEQGIDLSKHRSQPLTPELIHGADVIYCMTAAHRAAILSLVPSAADKIFTLDPAGGDVEDPVGLGIKGYRRSVELIRRQLAQRLKEQQV